MSFAEKETEEEDHGSVKIGARMKRDQIAFVPGDVSKGVYAKHGVAIEYHLLQYEDFAVDWSGMTLYFLTHTVTIEGVDLKGLLDQIKSHICDQVEVAKPQDALHAAAGLAQKKPKFDVRLVEVEKVEV